MIHKQLTFREKLRKKLRTLIIRLVKDGFTKVLFYWTERILHTWVRIQEKAASNQVMGI